MAHKNWHTGGCTNAENRPVASDMADNLGRTPSIPHNLTVFLSSLASGSETAVLICFGISPIPPALTSFPFCVHWKL